MKLHCTLIETCHPAEWAGDDRAHLALRVEPGMKAKDVRDALDAAIDEGRVLGNNALARMLQSAEPPKGVSQDEFNRIVIAAHAAVRRDVRSNEKGSHSLFVGLAQGFEWCAYFVLSEENGEAHAAPPAKLRSVRAIHISTLEWTDRTYGHTYFASRIYADGRLIAAVPFQPGKGAHHEYVAKQYLIGLGYLPREDRVSGPLANACKEAGIALVIDVHAAKAGEVKAHGNDPDNAIKK